MKASSLLLGIGVAALSVSAGVEGVRRFVRGLAGQDLAAAPSPLLTVLASSAIVVLGCWLCVVLLRWHRASLALILAWSSAATLVALLGHLNHAAYAEHCQRASETTEQAPPTLRCLELQRRGRHHVAATFHEAGGRTPAASASGARPLREG